jgi:hypothetical protein
MKAVRIILLVLIIIGLGLLFTQKLWVPKVVDYIILHSDEKMENASGVSDVDKISEDTKDNTNDDTKDESGVPVNSGVSGIVTMGPTCAVERIGQDPNECAPRPFSVKINILKKGSTAVLKTIQSGSDGKFHTELGAGEYILRPEQGGRVYPRCEEASVEIKAAQYTNTEIYCNTGIL